MGKLRLCYVGPCDSIVFRRWVEWFAGRGHDVTALTVEPARPEPAAFRQVDLSASVGWRKLGRFISAGRLAATVKRLMPDLVHVHYARGLAWGLLSARPHPLVVTPWGSDVLEEQGAFREWYGRLLTQRLLRSADLVTVHSAYMERRTRALLRDTAPVVRIGWGVDLNKFRPGLNVQELRKTWGFSRSDRVIFSPRIAQPFYRHELAVRALAGVVAKVPDAALAISGQRADRDYVEQLRREARERGVAARVKFVDAVPYDEMPLWYNLAEAVVMTPRSDGMPSTLLEAMACGAVPVLGRLPQYDELVRHRHNGFLAEPEPDALAAALVEALTDAGATTVMAERNRKLVAEVADQGREMTRLEQHYLELAHAGRAHR
jgi:glycosyltransferase involved in cell wall biosynthesis